MTKIEELSKNGTFKDFKFGEDLVLGGWIGLTRRHLPHRLGEHYCGYQDQQIHSTPKHRLNKCVLQHRRQVPEDSGHFNHEPENEQIPAQHQQLHRAATDVHDQTVHAVGVGVL